MLFITATELLDINKLREEDLFWLTTSEGSTHHDRKDVARLSVSIKMDKAQKWGFKKPAQDTVPRT